MNTRPVNRNNYLDWIRVFGILIVFVYHSSRFYNVEDWVVKNEIWYPAVEIWNGFATSWMMPLMFTISGASLFYALGKGGLGKFLRDKSLRLLIPLLFADLTHISLQSYLYARTHELFSGSYLQFLPQYYQLEAIEWQGWHLWYLKYLFIFSLISYPLLRWLKGSGSGVITRLGTVFTKTWVVYLLAIPILFFYLLIPSDSPLMEGNGGYPYILYLWFLLLGFIVASNGQLQDKIRRLRWVSLPVGLALVAGFIIVYSQISNPATISPALLLAGMLRVVGGWVCVLAIFGLGMQYLIVRNRILDYANEAVLPFYILHQTVLIAVGYFVIQWGVYEMIEWIVIVLISFVFIMGIYEYLVRHWNGMRFLFGQKIRPPKTMVPSGRVVQPH